MQRNSFIIAIFACAISTMGCGAGDVGSDSATGVGPSSEGNSESASVSDSKAEAETNQCSPAGSCVPQYYYCCSGLSSTPRNGCPNYCCLKSNAYNPGSASLCCSGSKRSGNYCW